MNAISIAERLAKIVVPNDEADARRARAAQSQAINAASGLWSKSGVPVRHADRALHPTPLEPDHPWEATRRSVLSAVGRGVTLCLCGTRGNGKTQIAVNAVLAVTRRGHSAAFTTAARLFLSIREGFGAEAKRSELQILDTLRKPDLLVIDEIGQRGETEWENRTFFELLNARYNDMTDTIMTCNLSVGDIQANIGPSIMSRMQEGGGVLECTWASFRE